MSGREILRLENVSKFYKTANNVALGIRKVNVSFNMGEFVLITGASGSGKSTLLNVLSGMTSYEEGEMYINGEDTSYYGHNEYEKYRKDYIACIFQNYNIIDSYSVYENIELALIARGIKKEERKKIIVDVAKKVGIDHRLKHKVTKLSGGEKQRTAIARALVSDAPILVCDEITGNLDHDTSLEIIELLHSLSQDKLVLMVTHDPEEVMQYATRIISMHDGMIQSDKVLKEVNDNNDVKIKDTKPISKKEVFKLALKSFKNTPKKSILLVLILLLATIFIGFACASIGANTERNLEDGFGIYYSSGVCYDKRRILVKRQDGASLADTDYNYFNNIDNVSYVFKNNSLIDADLTISYENYDEDTYFANSCFIFPVDSLDEDQITIGRAPANKDEIVVETIEYNYEQLKKLLNKEFTGLENSSGFGFKATLVGIIVSSNSNESKVYVNQDIYNKYEELRLTYFKSFSNGTTKDYVRFYLKGDNLPDNTINIYTTSEVSATQTVTTISWLDGGVDKYIEGVTINYISVKSFDDVDKACNLGMSNTFNYIEDYFYNCGVMSSNIYNAMKAVNVNETSIFVDDAKYVSSIQTNLNTNGYIAVNAYYEQTDSTTSIISAILSVFLYLFCIALTGVIYLLSFLSLKNVIYSERKDLLIMRSLGIGTKQVSAQIYIKLVGVSLLTTIIFISTSIILHTLYFPRYHILYSISHMRIIEMIYTFVLMMAMTFLLARKFAKNIFKANIASKDKEEPLQ